MDLADLLNELENFGSDNDRNQSERPRRMLNITRDTGQFLEVLVRATGARRILEIGTSNGYSTLWLAKGAQATAGRVETVELSDYKISLAKENFQRSGLQRQIRQYHANAADVLANLSDDSIDLLFLDSERSEYPSWWPQIRRTLAPGGLLVADNATSHAEEMAPFITLVEADEQFTTSLVPIGNGEYLATRSWDV